MEPTSDTRRRRERCARRARCAAAPRRARPLPSGLVATRPPEALHQGVDHSRLDRRQRNRFALEPQHAFAGERRTMTGSARRASVSTRMRHRPDRPAVEPNLPARRSAPAERHRRRPRQASASPRRRTAVALEQRAIERVARPWAKVEAPVSPMFRRCESKPDRS